MTFDKILALAEIDRFEILCAHHLRQASIARDRPTCLLFAAKLGQMASAFQHAAAGMKKERVCQCGAVVGKMGIMVCPGCGRSMK